MDLLLEPAPAGSNLPQSIPPAMEVLLMPGASRIYYAGQWGYILGQERLINGFTICHYRCSFSTASTIACMHNNHYAALQLVLKGGLFFPLPGMEFTLGRYASALLLLEPGKPVALVCDAGDLTLVRLHISITLFNKLADPALFTGRGGFTPPLILPLPKTGKRLLNKFLLINQLAGNTGTIALHLNHHCLDLVELFLSQYASQEKYSAWLAKKELTLLELENFIAGHLDTEYSHLLKTKQLARRTGLSVHRFNRFFQQSFGCSFAVYLLSARMNRALELLVSTGMSISAITEATGYSDVSSFSRAFSKFHGRPPSAVRSKN